MGTPAIWEVVAINTGDGDGTSGIVTVGFYSAVLYVWNGLTTGI